MEVKKSIVFNKIKLREGISATDVRNIIARHTYNENNGIGVLGVDLEDNIVHVVILLRTPTYINVYNQQTQEFDKNVVNVYDRVAVNLDCIKSLFYSVASSSKLTKVKNFIRSIFDGKISFDNIQLSYSKLVSWLNDDGLEYSILSMTIRKFRYDEYAVGRFSAQISSQETGQRLLNEYQDEVRNVVFNVDADKLSPFILQCALQNTLTLKCEEADFLIIVEMLKQHL